MTGEMNTLRNKRIELLKGMQGTKCMKSYLIKCINTEIKSVIKFLLCFSSLQVFGRKSLGSD